MQGGWSFDRATFSIRILGRFLRLCGAATKHVSHILLYHNFVGVASDGVTAGILFRA